VPTTSAPAQSSQSAAFDNHDHGTLDRTVFEGEPDKAYTLTEGRHPQEPAISTAATIAGLTSIFVSLWLGLALFMGIRGGERLPRGSAQATRVAFGVVTFFLWYAGMLAGMSILATLTVRHFRDVRWTVMGLLAATLFLWGVRRLLRQLLVPAGLPLEAAAEGKKP
jgi:hypothetical protein